MNFIPHTQEELRNLNIIEDKTYNIQYLNKDYYNGEETLEIGKAKAVFVKDDIYFNVTDPYGMDKLIMRAKVLA